jgi:hypothetical protein
MTPMLTFYEFIIIGYNLNQACEPVLGSLCPIVFSGPKHLSKIYESCYNLQSNLSMLLDLNQGDEHGKRRAHIRPTQNAFHKVKKSIGALISVSKPVHS